MRREDGWSAVAAVTVDKVGVLARAISQLNAHTYVHVYAHQRLHTRHNLASSQGRNFGLKSGGTNSEGKRGTLDPEARGEENGRKYPLLIRLWGLAERHELS